jgi:hypothetical protein
VKNNLRQHFLASALRMARSQERWLAARLRYGNLLGSGCTALHMHADTLTSWAAKSISSVPPHGIGRPGSCDRRPMCVLANLYEALLPIFQRYGFRPQSGGVISRDVSEKLEEQVVLHCKSFKKGKGFSALARHGQRWEVKICKGRGLAINQNAQQVKSEVRTILL